jgi:uncharacterized protein (TIGR00725 family)
MEISTCVIGVIGGGTVDAATVKNAYDTGALIAERGAQLVTGGLGGVMEAASRGAHDKKGTVIAIIPSNNKADANTYATVIIPSGMGIARNVLVVQTADVLIAFPGEYGTLSEISLALNIGKPVIAMPGVWNLGKAGVVDATLFKQANDPAHAVGLALGILSAK